MKRPTRAMRTHAQQAAPSTVNINSTLTLDERVFIRHALGLDMSKAGYRNSYIASGEKLDIGRSLAKRGLALELPQLPGNRLVTFVVTRAGFNEVAGAGETMNSDELAAMARREAQL
jgi:hypothetical protein